MQKDGQKPIDEIVISDTCCLISFEKINKLDLLDKLCKNIFITPEVLDEYEGGGSKKPSFIQIKEVKNKDQIKEYLSIGLHKGEASSIALYNECENPLLFTDDDRARKYATKNNIKFLTTLDILVRAREIDYIKTNEELHESLDSLLTADRWFSIDLINEIKREYNHNDNNITNNKKELVEQLRNDYYISIFHRSENSFLDIWDSIVADVEKRKISFANGNFDEYLEHDRKTFGKVQEAFLQARENPNVTNINNFDNSLCINDIKANNIYKNKLYHFRQGTFGEYRKTVDVKFPLLNNNKDRNNSKGIDDDTGNSGSVGGRK